MTRLELADDVEWLNVEDGTVVLVGQQALLLGPVAGAIVAELSASGATSIEHLRSQLLDRFGQSPDSGTGFARTIDDLADAKVVNVRRRP